MNITYWQSLPTLTQLEIEVRVKPSVVPLLLDGSQWSFKRVNATTLNLQCVYCHTIENYRVYCQYDPNEPINFLFDFNEGSSCSIYDSERETHPCQLTIISEKHPINQTPRHFISIPANYYEALHDCWTKVHLGYDYMDQGWYDVYGEDDMAHIGQTFDEIFKIDDEDEVYIFTGEGLWIDKADWTILEEAYKNRSF